jgi:hypothetical protein
VNRGRRKNIAEAITQQEKQQQQQQFTAFSHFAREHELLLGLLYTIHALLLLYMCDDRLCV